MSIHAQRFMPISKHKTRYIPHKTYVHKTKHISKYISKYRKSKVDALKSKHSQNITPSPKYNSIKSFPLFVINKKGQSS